MYVELDLTRPRWDRTARTRRVEWEAPIAYRDKGGQSRQSNFPALSQLSKAGAVDTGRHRKSYPINDYRSLYQHQTSRDISGFGGGEWTTRSLCNTHLIKQRICCTHVGHHSSLTDYLPDSHHSPTNNILEGRTQAAGAGVRHQLTEVPSLQLEMANSRCLQNRHLSNRMTKDSTPMIMSARRWWNLYQYKSICEVAS